MLIANPKRVCSVFAAEFDPQVSFLQRIAAAAETIQNRFKASDWSVGVAGMILQDTVGRCIVIIEQRRFIFQSLGLAPWQEKLGDHAASFKAGLEKIGVGTIKRLFFKVMAYLPVPMSHREMVALLPGSYLISGEGLKGVIGQLEDALVQLHGQHDDMKLQMMLAPMTEEQARLSSTNIGNLEFFLKQKLLDRGVREFIDQVATECLYLDIELSAVNVALDRIHSFAQRSLQGAEQVSEAAVAQLKSMKAKR